MDIDKFKAAYNESRNGANEMYRHGPFCRNLIYSDGIKELADLGCYWLLDIIGTEVVQAMRNADSMGVITVAVNSQPPPRARGLTVGDVLQSKIDPQPWCRISLSLEDDAPTAWTRDIEYTDMPDGEWKFFITVDGRECTLILMTEY